MDADFPHNVGLLRLKMTLQAGDLLGSRPAGHGFSSALPRSQAHHPASFSTDTGMFYVPPAVSWPVREHVVRLLSFSAVGEVASSQWENSSFFCASNEP